MTWNEDSHVSHVMRSVAVENLWEHHPPTSFNLSRKAPVALTCEVRAVDGLLERRHPSLHHNSL